MAKEDELEAKLHAVLNEAATFIRRADRVHMLVETRRWALELAEWARVEMAKDKNK